MSLSRYLKYKDSGVPWLGAVPEHWDVRPVKLVARIINGYPFDSNQFSVNEGFPLIRIRDLNQVDAEAYYVGDFVEAAAITQEDVLIGMDGDFNVGRWRGKCPALLNQRMCCVRGNSGLITRLLEYALPIPLKAINEVTYSTTVKHLASSQIEKTLFVAPPDEVEQAKIVEFLDQETGKIDALVQEQRQLIELLKEKRQAVISHAITKGLDPDAQLKESGIDWLGRVPSHWQVERARHLFEERDERSVTGEEEMLTVSHLTGVTPRSEKTVNMFEAETNEGYKKCSQGDLVINTLWAWMGAMGVAHQSGIVSPAYNVYVPRSDFSPSYVDKLVRIRSFADETARWSKGVWSSRLRLYPQEFFQIYLPVPPYNEQLSIAKAVDGEILRIELLSHQAQYAIDLLQERRTALISAAVTGKIDVRGLANEDAA